MISHGVHLKGYVFDCMLRPGSDYRSFGPIYPQITHADNLRKHLVQDLSWFRCLANFQIESKAS